MGGGKGVARSHRKWAAGAGYFKATLNLRTRRRWELPVAVDAMPKSPAAAPDDRQQPPQFPLRRQSGRCRPSVPESRQRGGGADIFCPRRRGSVDPGADPPCRPGPGPSGTAFSGAKNPYPAGRAVDGKIRSRPPVA